MLAAAKYIGAGLACSGQLEQEQESELYSVP